MTTRHINEHDGKGWLAHRRRPAGVLPDTIVLHATAGSSLSGAISTLRDKNLSYHYVIERSGVVWKCAPSLDEAFHAGVSTGPRGPGVNRHSIGICFVNLNDGKDEITGTQLDALYDLVKALAAGIPSLKWITTHYAITVKRDGSARKTDPRGTTEVILSLAPLFNLTPWKPSYATRYAL